MSQSTSSNFMGHPKGLFLLFTVEMWERFSYYGMRAIFILFLTKALLIDAKEAGSIFGIYTSLVYATPLIGGFIADRYWGNRRSILVGGILMAIAQFLMYISASMYATPSSSIPVMYVALAFLIFGNGFFKPNISSMVGSLYPQGDSRIDSAYTIFYMGINAGALVAPLVAGGLGDTGAAGDFKYGF
jgi:proton-dependent oligopeptide transporter, POT family